MSKKLKEFDYFELETKMRTIISGFIEPVLSKSSEQEIHIQNLLTKSKQTEESMTNFESLLSKTIIRMLPNETFNKKIVELYSDKKSTETAVQMKLDSLGSRVDYMSHQFSDMLSRIKSLEEIQKHMRMTLDDTTTALRELKESMTGRLDQLDLKILDCDKGDTERLDNIDQKTALLDKKIEEINQNAVPELSSSLEICLKQIKSAEKDIESLFDDRVFQDDLKKQKNYTDNEIKKSSNTLNTELNKLREYLDKMLRVEINCGVSDTLLQILDPRQLKKLIPLIESQISCIPSEGETKSAAVTLDYLKKKTITSNKEIEEKIQLAKKRITKDLEKPAKGKTIKKLEIEQIENNSKLFSDQSKLFSDPGASSTKRELDSRRIETQSLREISMVFEKEIPKIESTVTIEKANKESSNVKIELSPSSSSLKTEKSPDCLEEFTEMSLDPIWVQEQIGQLWADLKFSIQSYEEVKSLMNTCIDSLKRKVEEAQKSFSSTILILNDEVKIVGKQRIKDLSDVQSNLNERISEITEKILKLESNEVKCLRFNETILTILENEKIIYELIAQDEEDRKNIQLMGYSEGKNKKGNKQVVSLKPECLSCTGENPLIYSVFKMACLNYNPSEVKYNLKLYPRRALIEKLGELLYGVPGGDGNITERLRTGTGIANDFSSVKIKTHQRTRTASKSIRDYAMSRVFNDHSTPRNSRREFLISNK